MLKVKQVILMAIILSLSTVYLARAVHGAATIATSLSGVRAYPNPWRSDKHANMAVKFDNMPAGSTVKIFTISAEEVKKIGADSNGVALWDRTNNSGERIASGVYIYLVIDPSGNTTSGKLAIIN